MKWYPNTFKGKLKDLPALLLIYGEDGGLVSELSKEAAKASGVALDDPFASTSISAEDLAKEPSRLLEAASTINFMGGKQLIRVEGLTSALNANELSGVTEAVKACLEADLQDVQIIIPAPELDAKHALAKAVEADKTAAAVRCYHDSSRDIATVIRDFFKEKGKNIQASAVTFLTENLGNDRAVTKSELEKLDLYTGTETSVTLEDAVAILANAPSIGVFKLADALGNRNRTEADKLIQGLLSEGEDLNAAANLTLRHFKRLKQVQEGIDAGQGEQAALSALRPPVAFGKDEFLKQVRTYPKKRLSGVSAYFLDLQKASRQGHLDTDHVLARGLLALAG